MNDDDEPPGNLFLLIVSLFLAINIKFNLMALIPDNFYFFN
jgi:hypothetical protein